MKQNVNSARRVLCSLGQLTSTRLMLYLSLRFLHKAFPSHPSEPIMDSCFSTTNISYSITESTSSFPTPLSVPDVNP